SASAGDEDDGLLTASEIAGLRLDAEWVILSACNSASGNGAGSPTYGGLASAFLQAGARALLVSHWPVRDDAAERITVETVRRTAMGETRAVALQRATLALIADRHIPQSANPAIWAPFVLIDR
ncbi:MAG: CHAT domain-containing protein, partial [Novosphingobium sp.]|nr:CHAT domain-containing protein [Novosphingobium sp.]